MSDTKERLVDIGGVFVNPRWVVDIEPRYDNAGMCVVHLQHGQKGRMVECTKSAARVAQLLNGE